MRHVPHHIAHWNRNKTPSYCQVQGNIQSFIKWRVEVTAGWVSWAISNLPSPLGIQTLVKGLKPAIVASLNRGGVETTQKCKHAVSEGISGGPTYYRAYGKELSTSKITKLLKEKFETHHLSLRIYDIH